MNAAIREKFKTKKICVVVPTYNNATTLKDVIVSLLAYTDNVIVVNDGSTDETDQILTSIPEIRYVSYEKNQGKGFALRTGFKKAVAIGYEYAITIDSDGQHYADDLVNFASAVDKHPKAIIIGSRNLNQENVPGKSNFGNKFSSFWFWVNTGVRRSDTQSGYRLYPVKALDHIDFLTKKYEFEIEVIVRASWNGIDIVEIPIDVFYPEKEKRISHFRPFKDFGRISVLNTVLVTIALLYIKPRDFFRSLKKKTSVKSFATPLPVPKKRT
jgi:glycosyltransferase involved in cell wall biosynthesis